MKTDKTKKPKKKKFGLLGKNISYSFSKKYFTEKFAKINFTHYSYKNFDVESIVQFPEILANTKNLKGLNVTIPYKEAVIPYLTKLSKNAKIIGAVNVIKIAKNGTLKGYNSDFYGFKKALKPLLKKHHQRALILGTGGASKAVAYALRKLNIDYDFVSRNPSEYQLGYEELTKELFSEYQIIINTTPVGTFPNIDECPPLDYSLFTENHIAFDLIYNPMETKFLRLAKEQGAKTKNGYDMLVFQAEKAWEIWNK
ncbi:shikimate dehydrogenase [Flavobacterium cauense R2A-7]|uniref:Shikimate dehydrogenase n=1 Tax=Flavobacterium cauense R2A-7 TaxID=1341154 RepID=V6S2P6_9FLAO|nr:shikimate dehydrogenase [Flavobacterium cauense]ESU20537.1 shikimate dehydrogenase [Flavobacterium cauense R2A-7]KGO83071.1 shikimate dehydrogenase [Flavobacterium cauense R2A-7]TWI10161.1 shikimate dehydrogenase [Flavobacterium cauense R2A-7]